MIRSGFINGGNQSEADMAEKNTVQVLIGGKITRLSGYESVEYLEKVALAREQMRLLGFLSSGVTRTTVGLPRARHLVRRRCWYLRLSSGSNP